MSTGYYLPGHRGGGPIQSIANMVSQLSDSYRFWILTPNHDWGDSRPYEGVEPLTWLPVGEARVMYLPDDGQSHELQAALSSLESFDILYLNGFLHPHYTVLPLLMNRLGRIKRTPVVVAPRGDFSPGIFRIKRYKKLPFTLLSRVTGLYSGIHWHATSDLEATDIRRWFGAGARIHVAPNISSTEAAAKDSQFPVKQAGTLSAVFLSRIMKKKNLPYAIRRLLEVKGEVHLSIVGPVEDESVWNECLELLKQAPSSMTYEYHGALPHDQAMKLLASNDVFVLPTLGENYGHVIAEALAAGVPTVISDQTPWRELERHKAGFVLPLADESGFTAALQRINDMDSKELAQWRQGAREHLEDTIRMDSPVDTTRQMFEAVLR